MHPEELDPLPQTRSLSRKTSTLSWKDVDPSYEDLEPVSRLWMPISGCSRLHLGIRDSDPQDLDPLSSSFDDSRRHRPGSPDL